MRTLYFLCLLALAAVVMDIVLFHSGTVNAQDNQFVHVERISFNGQNNGNAPVIGRVVGFHCVDTTAGPQCFVASGFVQGLDHSR
jgi:hypothetical protein